MTFKINSNFQSNTYSSAPPSSSTLSAIGSKIIPKVINPTVIDISPITGKQIPIKLVSSLEVITTSNTPSPSSSESDLETSLSPTPSSRTTATPQTTPTPSPLSSESDPEISPTHSPLDDAFNPSSNFFYTLQNTDSFSKNIPLTFNSCKQSENSIEIDFASIQKNHKTQRIQIISEDCTENPLKSSERKSPRFFSIPEQNPEPPSFRDNVQSAIENPEEEMLQNSIKASASFEDTAFKIYAKFQNTDSSSSNINPAPINRIPIQRIHKKDFSPLQIELLQNKLRLRSSKNKNPLPSSTTSSSKPQKESSGKRYFEKGSILQLAALHKKHQNPFSPWLAEEKKEEPSITNKLGALRRAMSFSQGLGDLVKLALSNQNSSSESPHENL